MASEHSVTTARSGGSWGSWKHVAGAVLGLTVLLSVLLTAFAWPAANSEPREVPLAVAAPAPVAAQVEEGLATGAGGEAAFDVTRVENRAAAVAAIEDREVYGALVVGPSGVEMLTASAASPVVAQMLGQVAGRLPVDSAAGPPTVTDVVPLPADDPRGAGLAAGSLPLVLGGIAAAAVLTLRVQGTGRRLAGALGFAVAGGLAMTAILQFWLGSLEGSYWTNSAVVALAIGATATVVLALERLFGFAGLGLGAAVMLLLGNPLSGIASAPELLPAGWGAFGQLLPPGAAATALRSVAFFDGAGAGTALLVLGCWLAAGLLLFAVPVRRRSRVRLPDPEPVAV
jgi:hypothetical protein